MNLTLKNAALLLKVDIKELKHNLMPVIEALKETGLLNDSKIPYTFLQAYKYGSPLANYSIYLNKLEARNFLKNFGLSCELIDYVISNQSGFLPQKSRQFLKKINSFCILSHFSKDFNILFFRFVVF